jgi:uncharacterized membrane protein YgcG
MKNFFKLTAIAALVLLVFPKAGFAQSAQNFKFEKFDGDYYLQKEADNSSSMIVNETMVADFPSTDQNHGILRAIPQKYDGHSVRITNLSVKNERGAQYPYTKQAQNDNLVLKIGDPQLFAHGPTTYKISYTLKDVIKFFPDHDEFFWDINGDQWPQTFDNVTARIHVPASLSAALQDRRLCYEGAAGSTSQNCSINTTTSNQETLVTLSAANVGADQTLSVVMAFKPGTFVKSPQLIKKERSQKIETIAAGIISIAVPLLVLIFMFRRWRQFGNDPKGRGVIIPEYEPPKGMNVLYSDFLLKQKLRPIAITALLIDAAVRGNITIYEIPKHGVFSSKDYELELKGIPAQVTPEAQHMLQTIFGNYQTGTRIKLSDFKKDRSKQMLMYANIQQMGKNLAKTLYEKGYFQKDPKKVRQGYLAWAGALFVVAWGAVFASIALQQILLSGVFFALILSAVIIAIFAFIMPARTDEGVQIHDDLLGLRDYIKMAEADRLKFLQSPDGAEKIADKNAFDPKTNEAKVKLFEKLLPYAMLFGMEKDRGKQFEGLYTNPPGWYQGDWNTFSTAYLIGSLSDFNSYSATSFVAPSSSSGSGFSGGGAGGGGGGGGGGGW